MNQAWKIIVTVVITTIVVGGGVYYWEQNKIQPSSNPTQQALADSQIETAKPKSIDDYMNAYEKSPIKLSSSQVNQLVQVFSLGAEKCTLALDSEFCDPEMIKIGSYLGMISLFSDAGWEDGKDHEFYFALSGEGGRIYFGPFKDNIWRLKEEASQKENFLR